MLGEAIERNASSLAIELLFHVYLDVLGPVLEHPNVLVMLSHQEGVLVPREFLDVRLKERSVLLIQHLVHLGQRKVVIKGKVLQKALSFDLTLLRPSLFDKSPQPIYFGLYNFLLWDIPKHFEYFKEILTAHNPIGIVIVNLEHHKPLYADIAFSNAVHKVAISKEHSFKNWLEESDDVVAYVLAEPSSQVSNKQLLL